MSNYQWKLGMEMKQLWILKNERSTFMLCRSGKFRSVETNFAPRRESDELPRYIVASRLIM